MTAAIRFLLVDALNLIRRVYAALPGEDGPERAAGALASATQSLQRALRECAPSHAVCVFEGQGKSWRNQVFPEYKTGRTPMPKALETALPGFREAFLRAGVNSVSLPGLEADDVIGTLAVKAAGRRGQVIILSTDKIFLQLLSEWIGVRDHFGKRDLDTDYLRQRFGVSPDRLTDLLALCGDPTNRIAGVPGVGPKTAARLLAEFGSLEAILSGGQGLTGKTADAITRHREQIRIAHSLVRLRTDLELGFNLKSFRYGVRPS